MQKNRLKVLVSSIVAAIFLLPVAGCATNSQSANVGSNSEAKKPLLYATFFPVADLSRQIVGDKMEVKSVISGSQEPHDFELQTAQRAELSKADLIVYNGAGMEGFIDDLRESLEKDEKFLDLSQGLTLLKNKDAARTDNTAINPHTWLSVKNAQIELQTICEKVSALDPDNASYYRDNLKKAQEKFQALDKKFQQETAKIPAEKRYFVASHAAFNYLADDYGLKQVAVTGISPEDEPSANQLATIAEFVKKHQISTIFFEGKATPKVAETLARTTGAKTGTLYTMEHLTKEEENLGYLGLMQKNLTNLMESFR
ncbi:MAG: zinc ABC transporter substrate-binding protein [Varibaculum cambriense]|uniref:metal ABC transporter solute-binding protein, Zn/Mn family n=1 Tax=Varibaculum cambriense TaxID=184870 RepID=UPI0028FF7D39|nr:zinc ABC transporter substrate-binding protein [Varibaculum cambriense]MDU1051846.1 zinc ABC transporter substrate-binding protein [Varibaculum cambriense]